MDREQWRFVAGTCEKWQVSDLGRAAKWGTIIVKKRIHIPRRGSVRIYRLILETFVGPCPPGMECCHQDDDQTNNVLTNIRWDTKSSNMWDAYCNGKHRIAKVTTEQVSEARRLHETEPKIWTQSVLAKLLGVTSENMHMILTRKTWKNVS